VTGFSKSFQGRTFVFPDVAKRALGFFGRAFQRLDGVSGCCLVELEDPKFEFLFAVYASDPIEAFRLNDRRWSKGGATGPSPG
jgi:hypothetical protein